jgi:hypothetical protein
MLARRWFVAAAASALAWLVLSCGGDKQLAVPMKALVTPVVPTPGHPVILPTEMIGWRIFVKPVTKDAREVVFFTATEGDSQYLYSTTATDLELKLVELNEKTVEGKDPVDLAPIPPWRDGQHIPPPVAMNQPEALKTHYIVLKRSQLAGGDEDGRLGQGWFSGRTWTFDYPEKRLLWRSPGDLPDHPKANEMALIMQRGKDNKAVNNLARIKLRIDDKDVFFLFATGSTTHLTQYAQSTLRDAQTSVRGASFIARSIFDKWRAKHRDWRVMENAEDGTGNAMIEMPKLLLGGYEIGPVWFTARDDDAFDTYRSSMTDMRIDGTLGGNALRFFKLTVDFPNAVAVFQRPGL